MAAMGIYKMDDGTSYPTNCFPARSLLRPLYEEGSGHWQVARQTAEQSRFGIGWLLGSKSTRVKWSGLHRHLREKTLNRALLMKLHHVKSPSDLCSVDISNQNCVRANEEDFEEFDSVAYINATENLLTLETFCKFPALRELELSLNGLRNLQVSAGDFPHLEILDLSYNNLSPEDIRVLGVLSHLKVLHLTANGLSSLPLDLTVPDSSNTCCVMFPALEVLLLDDNHLSHPNVFVSLANLRSLKQLNLDRNGIKDVPYLHHVGKSRFSIHPLSAKSGIREGLRTRESAEIQRKRDAFSGASEQTDHIVVQNNKDPNGTEFLFQSCSPDTPVLEDTSSLRPESKISSASFSQEFVLPLAELRYLSLANNQIEHEEDLLAVALFPSLAKLTFYGNPFTSARSGDPPLLTSFLQNRLGIKLVRKKITKLEKPRIFIPVKEDRKVKSSLPKVRKQALMLEAPLETAFWQLWTETEANLYTGASLDESEPLPPISQFSVEKRSSVPLQDELESELDTVDSFLSRDNPLGVVSGVQTSFDKVLLQVPPVDQVLFASLPPRKSFLGEQSQSGLTAPTGSASVGQCLSQPLMPTQERNLSEMNTPSRIPSAEQKALEPFPPPSSSWQEGNPLARYPPTGPPTSEEDLSRVLQPTISAPGQLRSHPPPNLPSVQKTLSEPFLPTRSPTIEQDLAESPPLVRSTSVEQDLPETSPPAGSPGQLETPLCRLQPPAQDLPEPVSPPRSPSEGQDLCKTHPSIGTPSAKQVLPMTSLSFQAWLLSDPVPPSAAPERDQDLALQPPAEQIRLEASPAIEPCPSAQDRTDSVLSAVLSQAPCQSEAELLIQSSSLHQGLLSKSSSLSTGRGLVGGVSWERPVSKEQVSLELSCQAQSSREHLLLNRESSSLSTPSEDYKGCSSESLMVEQMESFFMTQVAEASGVPENLEKEEPPCEEASSKQKRKSQVVPKRYRGYELLLDGPTDPDFIEPRGIQPNAKALARALQNPLVYREARARLDSFQKPYVPMKKKILRVPVPSVQKTKAQKLEELLLQMRTPTNIVELPLVCVLRERKSNWREYREALGLLKEFRKNYKATVAAHDRANEPRATQKKLNSRDKQSQNQDLGSLAGVKVSGLCVKVPQAQATKDDKGL